MEPRFHFLKFGGVNDNVVIIEGAKAYYSPKIIIIERRLHGHPQQRGWP